MSCTVLRKSCWSLALAVAAFAAAPEAAAQFNHQWVSFNKETGTRLLQENGTPYSSSANGICTSGSSGTEADVAWGDLNNDGWVDVVIVRKQCFTSTGKRTNMLFMNENGVLRERTVQYATDADVGGDSGFMTATNDRDVVITDVDLDGWMDFVTATTISDGDPKYISHPRVYHNKGKVSGVWQGMRFENGRFPQLLVGGQPKAPRFCSVAAGDVTGDLYPDLFFGDYDSSGAGGSQEPPGNDVNDRLLINNGNGFFADESTARMTSGMLLSAFAMAASIGDFNQDGVNDVMKDTALNPPQNVSVIYNNPNNEGFFNIHHVFHNNAPYHINTGDLNRDGRLDVVVSDDSDDTYRLNTGVDGLGRVTWSGVMVYDYISGGDNSFASNNLIADLDHDGWNDVIICDVDVDINSSEFVHIYHNRAGIEGDAPGTTLFDLRLERQSSGSGWIGAVGLQQSDLNGGHDVAVFDIDRDGDNDMLLLTFDGGQVWINTLNPRICQTDLGFHGVGPATFSVCGGDLSTGTSSTVSVGPLLPGKSLLLVGAFTNLPTQVWELQSQLVPIPPLFVVPLVSPVEQLEFPLAGGGGPASLYLQWIVEHGGVATPTGYYATNAVRVDFLP